jgi:hypothetical protein
MPSSGVRSRSSPRLGWLQFSIFPVNVDYISLRRYSLLDSGKLTTRSDPAYARITPSHAANYRLEANDGNYGKNRPLSFQILSSSWIVNSGGKMGAIGSHWGSSGVAGHQIVFLVVLTTISRLFDSTETRSSHLMLVS